MTKTRQQPKAAGTLEREEEGEPGQENEEGTQSGELHALFRPHAPPRNAGDTDGAAPSGAVEEDASDCRPVRQRPEASKRFGKLMQLAGKACGIRVQDLPPSPDPP